MRCVGRCLLFAAAVGFASCASPGLEPDEWKRAEIERMYAAYEADELRGVTSVSPAELLELQQNGEVIVVDVRTPAEQAVSMLPGALSREAFEQRRASLTGETIVAYCTIGYRSGLYAKELQQEGLHIMNLRGSILAWTHAGGELVHEGEPTSEVHVYAPSWNLTAAAYQPVW